MTHEEHIIRAFVSLDRRPRFLELIASEKGRRKFLDALNHAMHLDPRYSWRLPDNQQSPEQIVAILRAKGASETCYAISDDPDLDGREWPLLDALQQSGTLGTFLSCVPGRLAYYSAEDQGERYICERSR